MKLSEPPIGAPIGGKNKP